MTEKKVRPHRIPIADEIGKFFRDNPGEFLTESDIEVKFNLTRVQAYHAIKMLQSKGLAVSMNVIFAGPAITKDAK